jgi:hypothetical protein
MRNGRAAQRTPRRPNRERAPVPDSQRRRAANAHSPWPATANTYLPSRAPRCPPHRRAPALPAERRSRPRRARGSHRAQTCRCTAATAQQTRGATRRLGPRSLVGPNSLVAPSSPAERRSCPSAHPRPCPPSHRTRAEPRPAATPHHSSGCDRNACHPKNNPSHPGRRSYPCACTGSRPGPRARPARGTRRPAPGCTTADQRVYQGSSLPPCCLAHPVRVASAPI